MHGNGTLHVVTATVHLASLAPAGGAGIQTGWAMFGLNPFKLVVEQVQGFVPGHSYKTVITTGSAVAIVPVLEPFQPYHRVTDSGRVVDQPLYAFDHLGRMVVSAKRFHLCHGAAFHQGVDGTPV